jgi:type IV pilus assembly protein PilE
MNKKGLTLIELLIVMVIVAILAAIAVPMYTGYMTRARRADAKPPNSSEQPKRCGERSMGMLE